MAIKVLFLLQRPEAWINVASLWKEMDRRSEFEPVAWLLPYNIKCPSANKRQRIIHEQILKEENVKYSIWSHNYQISKNQFDILVFTHPYDRERPRELSFKELSRIVKFTIYIPYALIAGENYQMLRYQYAQPIQNGASLIVARSWLDYDMYKTHSPAKGNNVKVLGHPRFDTLKKQIGHRNKHDKNNPITILWNSHFSFTKKHQYTINYSTLDLFGPKILRFFIQNPHIKLIWRPHPLLWNEFASGGIFQSFELDLFKSELDNAGIILDESPSHVESFVKSDAMLSDPGSFMFEYVAMHKPFLVLIPFRGGKLNQEAKEIASDYGCANNFDEIVLFIKRLLSTRRKKRDRKFYEELQEKYIPYFDGNSANRICDELLGKSTRIDRTDKKHFPTDKSLLKKVDVYKKQGLPDMNNFPVLSGIIATLEDIHIQKKEENYFLFKTKALLESYKSWFVERVKLMLPTWPR